MDETAVSRNFGRTSARIDRPILFSGAMVRAILDGHKTQTRRIVKPQPPGWATHPSMAPSSTDLFCHWTDGGTEDCAFWPKDEPLRCPYGKPGDRLWVRETWATLGRQVHAAVYRADNIGYPVERWRPSIHMPKWASRITLEVTGVRVERVQRISEADAVAEGVDPWPFNPLQPMTTGELGADSPYRGGFAVKWDEINEDRGTWYSNPWVWVVEFNRIEADQ